MSLARAALRACGAEARERRALVGTARRRRAGVRTADQVRWGTGGGKRVVPSEKSAGTAWNADLWPVLPVGAGIARERETRADDAPLCLRECRTLSQSRMVRPLTASSSERAPYCGWCWAHGYVSENVAGEGIDGALPRMPAVKQHFRALPYSEVAAALETVEASRASEAAKLCRRFLILTAARPAVRRGRRLTRERGNGAFRVIA